MLLWLPTLNYHFFLCPRSNDGIDYMSRVSYSSTVRLLIYTIFCIHPDLACTVSRYMANPAKEH